MHPVDAIVMPVSHVPMARSPGSRLVNDGGDEIPGVTEPMSVMVLNALIPYMQKYASNAV